MRLCSINRRLVLLALFLWVVPLRLPWLDWAGSWAVIAGILAVSAAGFLLGQRAPLNGAVLSLFAFVALLNISALAADDAEVFRKTLMLSSLAVLMPTIGSCAIEPRPFWPSVSKMVVAISILQSFTGILLSAITFYYPAQEVVSVIVETIAPYLKGERELVQLEESIELGPLLNWGAGDGTGLRNVGTMLSPIVTAAYLGMSLFILIGVVLRQPKGFWVSATVFVAIGFALTMTRGALLSFALALFAAQFVVRSKKWSVINLALVAIVAFVFILSADLQSRILSNSHAASSSIEYRLVYLKNGVDAAMRSGAFGVGLGKYEEQFAKVRFNEYPHNQYVELWAETGLASALALLVFFGTVCARALRYRFEVSPTQEIAIDARFVVLGTTLFIATYATFEDLLNSPAILGTYMVILGVFAVRRGCA